MHKTTATIPAKPLLKIAFIVPLLLIQLYGQGQQLVQTPADIHLLCRDEDKFIGKPLKTLLDELKPEIKLVLAEEGGGCGRAPQFFFYFTSRSVYLNYRKQDKFPLRLRIYLNEPFVWWKARKTNSTNYQLWTEEDARRYENLTIRTINVAGEYNACDYGLGLIL